MALFGEKCARCGMRTKHTYRDVPTCEDCETELQTKMKADTETKRECPIDQAAMVKEVVHAIVIDRCPTCQGVWLDAGELDYIKRGIELGTSSALLRGMAYPF